jgi:hypothetical protein
MILVNVTVKTNHSSHKKPHKHTTTLLITYLDSRPHFIYKLKNLKPLD